MCVLIQVDSHFSCERELQIFRDKYWIKTLGSWLGVDESIISCANFVVSEILRQGHTSECYISYWRTVWAHRFFCMLRHHGASWVQKGSQTMNSNYSERLIISRI